MKIKYFLFCFLFSTLFLAQNSWEILNPKPSSGTNKEIVFNNGKGFMINDLNELITTSDNGSTWEIKQKISSGNDILFFQNTGFIVGDNGYVLKSTDSGTTWNVLNIGTSEKLNSVSIFTDKIFISSNKTLFVSTNGTAFTAKTVNIPNPLIAKSVFTTSSEGHLFSGGKAYRTTDSGDSWTQTFSYNGVPNDLNMMYFKNQNEGYINFGHREFRKTIDAGQTWTEVNGNFLNAIKSMYFTDQNTGFAVGVYQNIYKTTDNGATWVNDPLSYFGSSGNDLNSVSFINPNQGFAVGMNGIILKTNDAGSTWTKNSFTYDNLSSVQKVGNFYYLRSANKLYKSADQKNWQELGSPTQNDFPYIMDFKMVTSNIAFALVGTAGSAVVYKSTDGAETWAEIPNTYGGELSLQFLNENVGYRTDFGIYKTIDGGNTWNKIVTPYIYSVYFVTEDIAFGIRDSKLYKSVDGGTTFNLTSGDEYIGSYQFLNTEEGFAAGNYSLLKTIDGGTTWEKIPTSKSYEYVNFQNSNIGFLSGQYSDDHLRTDNGGATWESIPKIFPAISRNVLQNQLMIGGTYGKLAVTNLSVSPAFMQTKLISSITAQKAEVIGYASANAGNLEELSFEYSINNNFENSVSVNGNPMSVSEGKNASISTSINSLIPDTTYFVRAKGKNGGNTIYGNILEFRTKQAFTEALVFSKIKSKSLVLNAEISSNDDKGIQNIKVIYGTESANLNATLELSPNNVAPNTSAIISGLVNDLQPNSTYYFKIKFTYNGVENLSKLYTVKTIEGPKMYLETYNTFSPKFSGYIQADEAVSNITFQYGTQLFENSILGNPSSVLEASTSYVTSQTEPLLNENKTYYSRIKATHNNIDIYSNVEIFNPFSAIVLAKNYEQKITENTAKINGFIRTNGYSANNLKIKYGVSPQVLSNSVDLQPGSVSNYETSAISGEISGLDFNTTYYYQFTTESETGKLTVYNSDIYSFKLADLQLAVSESVADEATVYPNPVVDYFKIKSFDKISTVEIYDAPGKLVKRFANVSGMMKNGFDISNLNTGIYFVKIEFSSGKTLNKKLIKK